MSDFGTQLKHARKLKGFTQKDLSKKLGVAQSTIANYETNERFPGEVALKEIADCLKVSIDFLMGLSEHPSKTSHTVIAEDSFPLQEELMNECEQLYRFLTQKQEPLAIELVKSLTKQYSPLFLLQHLFEPVLVRTGDDWLQGIIDISTEHFISGVVEHLIASISEENRNQPQKNLKVALVVPGAEEHVITLKMAAEHFRYSGWNVYYLGRSLPIVDFHRLISEQAIDLVVLSVTISHHINSADHFIQALRLMPSKHPFSILVAGRAFEDSPQAIDLINPDYYVPTLKALEQLIPTIENQLLTLRASG